MKKVLTLLSILIISGTAVPNVIAVSQYKKQENIYNKINYKQTNNLKDLNRIKRQNNKKVNFLEKTKVVIKTNGYIYSDGVVLNNKVYFGSTGKDHNLYEYDPTTGQQKIAIKINGEIYSSGVVLNNKLYFGSFDYNVYEYDPTTGQQKIAFTTNGKVRSNGVVLNNKVYFGSHDGNIYEYNPVTKQNKIIIRTNDSINSSGVVLNNKLYFGSFDYNVYEYDPTTGQQKISFTTNGWIDSSGVVLNNKVYIGSGDKNVYEYDPITGQQKIIIKTNGHIYSDGVVLNNKVYFGSTDKNVYEYDPTTGQQKIVITASKYGAINSSGIILNNKIYFGSNDHNVYEYDPTTGQQKIIIKTESSILSSGVVLNNRLYFGSLDYNVYEYSNYYNDLGQINYNSGTAILNEWNYFNPDLDISQLEVTNITDISAKINSNKSINENIVNYIVNNSQNEIIYLCKLIKKAIFFKYRDENTNLKFKKIVDINTDNLNFENIEITRNENSKLLYNVDYKDVCFNKKIFTNIFLKDIQKRKLPKCDYNAKSKLSFQIMIGLSKKNQENKITGWNINIDDEIKLSNFVNINNRNNEITSILSENFNLSNNNKQEQEIILHSFNEDDYEISVDPKTKLEIKYSVREINLETILNLKQKITGIIDFVVIDDKYKDQVNKILIKEAMEILQKYDLLSDKITINKDNSITFNGKAKIILTQESEPKLIMKILQI